MGHPPKKGQFLFLATSVDRKNRCLLSFGVSSAFTWEEGQKVLDACHAKHPKVKIYYSDACETYRYLMYPGPHKHQVSEGKRDTFSVEGTNADLRHYLARLARRSRCFTRCPEALRCAVRLFQCAYNQRQIWKHEHKLARVPGLCDCLPLVN